MFSFSFLLFEPGAEYADKLSKVKETTSTVREQWKRTEFELKSYVTSTDIETNNSYNRLLLSSCFRSNFHSPLPRSLCGPGDGLLEAHHPEFWTPFLHLSTASGSHWHLPQWLPISERYLFYHNGCGHTAPLALARAHLGHRALCHSDKGVANLLAIGNSGFFAILIWFSCLL